MPLIHQSSYHAPFLLRNGDLQTIYPTFKRKLSPALYQRERMYTLDDDFLDLDWSRVNSRKLVILSHGLEGSTYRHYMIGMATLMNRHGWDALAWNYRGCSGKINRRLRMYHNGSIETIMHRTGIIPAMITGKKLSDETERPLSTGMPLAMISFAWVVSPLFAAFFFSTAMETKQPMTLTIPPLYKKECASCHMAFPPNVLPAKSWKIMMADLQDHFGDDASIDESARKEIENFLVRNSAEQSLEEASIKLIRPIGKDNPPLRITDIPYWKEKHKSIRQAIYQRETIKSKINCVACHKWAEYGSFEDSDIKIPRK